VQKLISIFEQKFGKKSFEKLCKACFGPNNQLEIILRSGDIGQMRNSYREHYNKGPGNFSRLPIVLSYLVNNFSSKDELDAFLERLDMPIVSSNIVWAGSRITRISEYMIQESISDLLALMDSERGQMELKESTRIKKKAERMEKEATYRQFISEIGSHPLMENLFDLLDGQNVRDLKLRYIDEEAKRIVRKRDFYKTLLSLSRKLQDIRNKNKVLPALLTQHAWANSRFFINVRLKEFWNDRKGREEVTEDINAHGRLLELDEDKAKVEFRGGSLTIYRENILNAIKGSDLSLTSLRLKLALELRSEYNQD
jgi:hypothetical protein